MTAGEALGWLAAALTLLTFSMRSMIALRIVGLAANVSFIIYGAITLVAPVLVLHLLLFPCNLIRLWQLLSEKRSCDGAGESPPIHRAPGSDSERHAEVSTNAPRWDWLTFLPSANPAEIGVEPKPFLPAGRLAGPTFSSHRNTSRIEARHAHDTRTLAKRSDRQRDQ